LSQLEKAATLLARRGSRVGLWPVRRLASGLAPNQRRTFESYG
jgi:hypothetical protein